MEKPINTICNPKTTLISKDLTSESISLLDAFLKTTGVSEPPIPQYLETKDSYSVLIHSLLKLNTVQRGRISYLLSVKPAFLKKDYREEMKKSSETIVSKDVPSEYVTRVENVFKRVGAYGTIPSNCNTKGFYLDLVGGLLKVDSVERGRISCLLIIKPVVVNIFGGMHGGAVGAVSEVVSIACARTVVGEDKELFLGEHSISYLSAAPANAEVIVDGSVVRSGRNVTVIAIDFRLKESGRLAYTSSATFYNMGVASL